MTLAVDVVVVGGGINGAGIARDLAGRGWRVLLVERDDLAAHTSSASTKLIHGGLRYLEQREFGLVRKALREREVLLRSAPHIAWPLRFVMPHDGEMRPAWMIRAALFLYDHLARRERLAGSAAIDLRTHPAGAPLSGAHTLGFVYSDGWVDDARLVVLNARDAADRGARVRVGWGCESARVEDGRWHVALRGADGLGETVRARALVNATGPWAASFLEGALGRSLRGEARLRLVKGSHIVVPARFDHGHAYLLQNADGRILFMIPYEQRFTLIGTTDVETTDDPGSVRTDAAEVDYLCAQANRYLRAPVSPANVVWQYAGVRPLLEDGAGEASAVTRDYRLALDTGLGAPLLTVWGGKLTTYRKLAEEAATQLGAALGEDRPAWTRQAILPGGDLETVAGLGHQTQDDFERFVARLSERFAMFPGSLVRRWCRAYGTRCLAWLGNVRSPSDLGDEIAPGLYEAEVRYLVSAEWARSADDVLWRRSKLGLHFTPSQREAVTHWFARRPVPSEEILP